MAIGVVVDDEACHERVDRDRAGVVGHHQRTALGRDVLDAVHLDPEPLLRQRPQPREEESLGDLLVEAELVDLVVSCDPTPREREQVGELLLPVDLAEILLRGSGDGRDDHLGALEHLRRSHRAAADVAGRRFSSRRGGGRAAPCARDRSRLLTRELDDRRDRFIASTTGGIRRRLVGMSLPGSCGSARRLGGRRPRTLCGRTLVGSSLSDVLVDRLGRHCLCRLIGWLRVGPFPVSTWPDGRARLVVLSGALGAGG
jgi:hypothetical protein